MKEFRFTKKQIKLVEATLKYTEVKVKATNKIPEPARVITEQGERTITQPVYARENC